jgi:hypothetical protein
MTTNKLTDSAVRNAQPGAVPYKMADGGGLYLEVAPAGGKWWRLKYRFGGKEKRLALGVYPDVKLADARQRRDEARRLLANGIDPAAVRREQKARDVAQRKAGQGDHRVRVALAVDGQFEIWKGGAVVRLHADEAAAVRDLLVKLTEVNPWR